MGEVIRQQKAPNGGKKKRTRREERDLGEMKAVPAHASWVRLGLPTGGGNWVGWKGVRSLKRIMKREVK